MKTRMSCGTAFVYLFMSAVIDFGITTYLLSRVDNSSYNYGLYSGITLWLFSIPAFFLGFILFVMLDWGLKRLLVKPSPLAPLSILIALSVPFIWEYFQAPESNQFFIPLVSSVTMLIWSLFVVRVQLRLIRQEEKEKPKNGL